MMNRDAVETSKDVGGAYPKNLKSDIAVGKRW